MAIMVIIEAQGIYSHQNLTTIITTLYVGHGTCHIIQNNNHTVVIDAGSRNNIDIGYTKIIPTLNTLNIRHIDLLLITHADLDHIAGIPAIIETIPIHMIGTTWQSIQNPTGPLDVITKIISKHNIHTRCLYSGTRFTVGELLFEVISPDKSTPYTTKNATSLVVQLSTNGKKILFTGDINEEVIANLDFKEVYMDVIELPHHGQWSEESQWFINKQTPTAVIQSTSRVRHAKDLWDIPTNTERYVTAIDGDITITINTSGEIQIVGSKNPVTMGQCLLPK